MALHNTLWYNSVWFVVFVGTWAEIFSNYQLNAQFLYDSTICMLHYDPQHVLNSMLLILRRTNCFTTAFGIVTLEIGERSYITRVVPKVMSNNFFHANWEQQVKESMVVDGTSCCVILECLVTSIACIT